MLPVLIAAAVVLLAVAAVHDWRARRRGEHERTRTEYWRSVAAVRREERREHATRYFSRFLPKR